MKTFYCVTSSYYDDGRAIACITDIIVSRRKPSSTFHTGRRCDVYIDWFDTREAAEEHVKRVRGGEYGRR